ncbi:MAG: hypothetical protein ACRCUT_12420 [Spirochaetota bacterium]
MKKQRRTFFLIFSALMILAGSPPLSASDSSDAEALRARCEKENKAAEVCVMNAGSESDAAAFAEAAKKLKLAKLKIAQSKFAEAISLYNEYLKNQNDLYTVLAAKYIDRTQKANDAISEELVDFIDQPKVDSYLKLSYRNLEEAKTAMTRKYPVQAIEACRRSIQYSTGIYSLVSRQIPEKYKSLALDAEGKIVQK